MPGVSINAGPFGALEAAERLAASAAVVPPSSRPRHVQAARQAHGEVARRMEALGQALAALEATETP